MQLEVAISSKHKRHQRLEVNAMDQQEHIHEAVKYLPHNDIKKPLKLARRVWTICSIACVTGKNMTMAPVLLRMVVRFACKDQLLSVTELKYDCCWCNRESVS